MNFITNVFMNSVRNYIMNIVGKKYHSNLKLWQLILIFIFIIGIPTPSPSRPVDTLTEAKIKADLENEIQSLQHLPGDSYERVTSTGKDHQSWSVWVYFYSKDDFQTVFSHYDKQLKAHGWTDGPKQLKLWGNDRYFGYKKGDYTAEIGNESGNKYIIVMHWH